MSNIIMSAEFMTKAKSSKSFEELKSLVAAEGIEVAEDELMARWEEVSAGAKKFKLSEEELDNVAGGCGYTHEDHLAFGGYTGPKRSVCPVCGAMMEFKGDGVTPSGLGVLVYYYCADGDVTFRLQITSSGDWTYQVLQN